MRPLKTFVVIFSTLLYGFTAYSQSEVTSRKIARTDFVNREFFSLFDSFGESGVWQAKLSEISGMNFEQAQNFNPDNPISYGGTKTGVVGSNCGMQRAVNLVDLQAKGRNVDYLFIENVNDANDVTHIGTIDDPAWFRTQEITLLVDVKLSSVNEADRYWKDNYDSLLQQVAERKNGTVLLLPYETANNGYKFVIEKGAQKDGDIFVTIGTRSFGINVTSGMSAQEIILLLNQYNYGAGWTTTIVNDSSIVVSYYISSSIDVSIDVGDTGVECSKEICNSYAKRAYIFTGTTSEEWNDITNWKTYVTTYSQYKGLLEYLISNLKDTKIYWMIPSYFAFAYNDLPTDEDGEIDMEQIEKRLKNVNIIFDCQKNVCAYYDIPVLDVQNECGIDIYNASQFYNNNNVHPKKEGYYRWAETMYRLMTEKTIIDGETYASENEEDFEKICYKRTFNNTDWQAWYVPFNIDRSMFADDFEVAYINNVHQWDDDDDGAIDRTEIECIKITEGELQANTPYMIKSKSVGEKTIVVENSTLYAAVEQEINCSSTKEKYTFTGTYKPLADTELVDCYALSGGAWKLLEQGSVLNPFRVYLKIENRENSALVPERVIDISIIGEGNSTAIDIVAPDESANVYYNLQGCRVNNPTKGVYIFNGKLVSIP